MDELQISGKRYISSRRIARENGYTADYIGQLIRGGKLAGQKVGRAWYVEASSFEAFSGAPIVAQEILPPLTELNTTASEAPVQEETIAVQPIPEAETIPVQIIAPAFTPVPVPAPVAPATVEIKIEEPRHVPLSVSGLRYYSDDEPLLPEIVSSNKVSRQKEITLPKESIQESASLREGRRGGRGRVLALGALAIAIFAVSAVVSSAVTLHINIDGANPASAFYTIGF